MSRRWFLRVGVLALCSTFLWGCKHKDAKEEEKQIVTWYIRGEDEELYENLKGIKEIEKATGTDIQFIVAPNDGEDAYKLMLSSGKLPDVISWSYISYANGNGVNQLYNDGVAIDLTEYVKEYAPNLLEIYEKRPEIRREVYTFDDKMIYFPSINPLQREEEWYRMCYAGPIIRKDWLEKLGLEIPQNIDDWYTVLKAFKEKDPNGNGMEDEIPFDGKGISIFAPSFGVLGSFYINSDSTVSFGYIEQSYKEYLETMNAWYAEGLLSKSSFALSNKWTDANIINNVSGSFYGLDNAWRYYLPSLQAKDETADFVAVPYPMAEDGRRYVGRSELVTHIRKAVTIVTSQCKNPEAVVRLIDYFYSEEGTNLLTWGIEGETYEVVDGEKRLLPEALEFGDDKYMKLHRYAIAHNDFPKYDGETVLLQMYPSEQLEAEMIWSDFDGSLIYPPNICFTSEENDVVSNIMTDMNAYIEEMTRKYITGEEELSTFDNFVYNVKKMGIEKVLDIYQKNYDLYRQK